MIVMVMLPIPAVKFKGSSMSDFILSSPDFKTESVIPKLFTCLGTNISPTLNWRGAPSQTQSYALSVTDPDAPGGNFIHWVIYNIPKECHALPQNIPTTPRLDNHSLQGPNDFGTVGYKGPCPPPGETHRYVFTLYAVDQRLTLPPQATFLAMLEALKGHILAKAQLVALFTK